MNFYFIWRTLMKNYSKKPSIFLLIIGFFCSNLAISQDVLTIKNDRVGVGETDPDFILHIKRSDGQGAGFKVETINAPSNKNWFFQQNSVTGAFLVTPFEGGNAPLQIFPGDGSIIKNSLVIRGGKVGIGTNDPKGKLDVNGSIYQRSVVRHPDYVFEPDYKIETIEEHSEYMWKNKHLPAIGAGQYDEEGFAIMELGDQSKGILEELEKAHIYIETLNDQIKELSAALEKQKRDQEIKNQEINAIKADLERMYNKNITIAESGDGANL